MEIVEFIFEILTFCYCRLTSVTGRALFSPRHISVELFGDVDRPHEHLNLMVMQFGQLIAHDVTQSAIITLGDYENVFLKFNF